MFSLGAGGANYETGPGLRFASAGNQVGLASPPRCSHSGPDDGWLVVDLTPGGEGLRQRWGDLSPTPFVQIQTEFLSNIKCSVFSTFVHFPYPRALCPEHLTTPGVS